MSFRLTQLTILFLLFCSGSVFSQVPGNQPKKNVSDVSDAQIEQLAKEINERGLNEQQLEAIAKYRGYSKEDIDKIKLRLKKLNGTSNYNNEETSEIKREQLDELSKREIDLISDDENKPDSAELKKPKVFGLSLFSNKNLLFEPNINIATPENYVLGTNDGLSIDISGYAYQHYSVSVSPEGTIKLESLAPIFVSGLTIKEAKKKITERLKTIFGGLRNGSLSCDVTLTQLKSIKVTLAGEVQNPGSYTVSSMATIFNALYVAGGPTEKGSFRSIQLLRNNKIIADFDLYDFLVNGRIDNNEMLHDQDVIFIPVSNKKVTLDGFVKTPAIFELKGNENFINVLKFAGGFKSGAYTRSLKIKRITDKELKFLIPEKQDYENTYLLDGDDIFVFGVLNQYENMVKIHGAINRPGDYAIDASSNTIKDIINLAEGLRDDAFMRQAILFRKNQKLDSEIFSLDLTSNDINFGLKNEDSIVIKSYTELREKRYVTINGSVNVPGEYEFSDNMKVSDLILLAGGLSEGANSKNIEIARRISDKDPNSGLNVIVLKSEIDKNSSNAEKKLILKPFDEVYVRNIPNYEVQKKVQIYGLINQPGTYVIKSSKEKIADLVGRAGGITENAYLKGSKLYRKGAPVSINLEKILENPNDLNNILLQENDSLFIPQIEETVTLRGEFLNPVQVTFSNSLKFSDYISQAGGFTDSAFMRKTYVKYANGLTDRTRSFFGIRFYPKVERGMTIIAPAKHRERMKTAELLAITSAITSLGFLVLTALRTF